MEEFFRKQAHILHHHFNRTVPAMHFVDHSFQVTRIDNCRPGFVKNEGLHSNCATCCGNYKIHIPKCLYIPEIDHRAESFHRFFHRREKKKKKTTWKHKFLHIIILLYILCIVHSCITKHFHSVLTYDTVLCRRAEWSCLGTRAREQRVETADRHWQMRRGEGLANADRKENTIVYLSCV